MTVSKLFVILFWVWMASELLLQVITRTGRGDGRVADRGSLPILVLTIFASIWAALWCGSAHAGPTLDRIHWPRLAALLLLLAGMAIRWLAILTLGFSFSTNVAIHPAQTLHRNGLFRWVRHPSYTGMLLIFAAIGLAQRNWFSIAIMLVFPMAALIYRIHVEEIALMQAFGQDYVEYRAHTSRLVPGIY